MEIFIRTIEEEEDAETRNLATQVLTIYLQMNVGNCYGFPATFYQKVQDYDEMRGHVLVPEFVKYWTECESKEHQIDCMLLLNQLCTVDSNHLVEVADIALPLLRERIKTGTVIEQYSAILLTKMIANRFDLAGKLIDSGIVQELVDLFHILMDQYKYGGASDGGATSYSKGADGKALPLSTSIVVPGHNLPLRVRNLCKQDSLQGGVPLERTLSDDVLKQMLAHSMHDVMETIVEVAGASQAAGRRHLLEMGALNLMKRCFDFPETSAQDSTVHDDLQHESLRAAHGFLSGPFSERDIEVDADMRLYNNMISRFKTECDEGDSGESEFELLFDTGLSPLQRRKAHIMCAYNRCGHNSIGTGFTRQVACTYAKTPSKPASEDGDADALTPKAKVTTDRPAFYNNSKEENFEWNWQRCAEIELPRRLLALKGKTKESSGAVMFHIVDLLLLLLEHDMITDKKQFKTVKKIMIDAITSSNVGMAVMGSNGAELIVIKNKVRDMDCPPA